MSVKVKIRKERVLVNGLAEDLEGYRVLHVSDIHFDDAVRRNQLLRQEVRSGIADLILITGDFITLDINIDGLVDFLDGSYAADGIFGILGNHDYYKRTLWHHVKHGLLKKEYAANDWQRLVSSLAGCGVRVFVNEHVLLRSHRGAKIFLEGTDDPVLGRPEISEVNRDYLSSDLRILMSHSPDILHFEGIAKKKFDLLLTGHTHGGQVRLPGIGPVFTGTRFATRRESYGFFRTTSGLHVSVSAGIGYSLLPIRINCEAEITYIEFSRLNRS
jgi:hypothetical protein